MKTHHLLFLLLLQICTAILPGCAPAQRRSDEIIPPPTISDAVFPPGKLQTIRITGEYFKMKSDNKSDVVVSIGGAHNWTPVKKVIDSSSTEYVAEIPWEVVADLWVRVYGMNDEYSGPYLVHVPR